MKNFNLFTINILTILAVVSSLTRHCKELSGDTLDVKGDETITISTDIPQIWIKKTKDGQFVSTFTGCIIRRGSMFGGSFWMSTAARFEFSNKIEIDGTVDFYGENSLSLVSINDKINIKKPISLQITEPRSQNYLSMKFLGGYAPSQTSLHGFRYGGPGKGRCDSTPTYATGAGHGGQGGRMPLDTQGDPYGINDTCTYIGGSLGGSSNSALPAFGGPTIELIAALEMQIDDLINVNAPQVSSTMGKSGGSSGGRIRLWTRKLRITSKGILYARGSPGMGVNAGGGGGGVVQIVAEEADIEGSIIQVQAGSSNGSVGNAAVGQFFILGRQDAISSDKVVWKDEPAYKEENCIDMTVMPTSSVLYASSSSMLAFQTTYNTLSPLQTSSEPSSSSLTSSATPTSSSPTPSLSTGLAASSSLIPTSTPEPLPSPSSSSIKSLGTSSSTQVLSSSLSLSKALVASSSLIPISTPEQLPLPHASLSIKSLGTSSSTQVLSPSPSLSTTLAAASSLITTSTQEQLPLPPSSSIKALGTSSSTQVSSSSPTPTPVALPSSSTTTATLTTTTTAVTSSLDSASSMTATTSSSSEPPSPSSTSPVPFSISPSPQASPSSQLSSSSSSSSSLLPALPQSSTSSSSFLSTLSTPLSTSSFKSSSSPPTLQTSTVSLQATAEPNFLTMDQRIRQLYQEIKSLKDMNSTETRGKTEFLLREFENLTSSKELSAEGIQTSISVVMYFNKILLKMASWNDNLDFVKTNVTSLLHSIDNLLEMKVDTKQDTQNYKSEQLVIAMEGTTCIVMETMERLNESYSYKTNNIEIYGQAHIDTHKVVNIPARGEGHQDLQPQAAMSSSSNTPSPSGSMLSFEPRRVLKECNNKSCDGNLLVLFSVIKNTRLNGPQTNASISAQVTKAQVNSEVMTVLVTYNSRPVHKLNKQALLRFNHQIPSKTRVVPSSVKCAYLQYTSSNDTGTWISDGLTKISTNTDQTVCSTNHLTSFAVLMQFAHYEPPPVHAKAINIITYVGSSISLAALLITILAYIALGEALSARRYKIHLNLSIALGLAQAVFLAGIDSTKYPVLCAAIAVGLHYLYLSAFSWMAIEGLHLYFKIVTVFNTEGIKLKYYMMFGWGFPVFLVLISAASNHEGYGKGQTCWLSMEEGFRWSFIGPIAAMIGFNCIILVLTLRELLSLKQNIGGGDEKRVKTSFKATIILLPLLGTTWCFGFFGFNSHTIVFQYLFALFTSLQGLFIFLFHCIGNSEVRHALKRLRIKHSSRITSMLNAGSSRPPKSHASHSSIDKDDRPDVKRDSWVSPTPSNNDRNEYV